MENAMQDWKSLLLLGLPLVLVACGDKEIEDEDTTEDTDTSDTEDTGETVVEENEPLVPVAIGFEYSGIWNEAGNDGAGSLEPYLFPDLNNENGGVPFALGNLVTVTLASVEYFSLGSGATDEERAFETCTVYADFAYSPANLLAQDFDWTSGTGSTGDNVDLWQSFEGTLIFRLDSASERCAELDEGYSLDTFDGMRFGIGMGPLSTYMSGEFASTDWWADDLDAQGSYHTQYIAVNHPAETDLGYNFVAYDWTSAIMVNVDAESCVDAATGEVITSDVESETKVCGEVMTVEEDGAANYDLADQNENFGSRNVYVQGSSWWYEDYPNLDLDLMKEYPE
jgi:hypothetical protein